MMPHSTVRHCPCIALDKPTHTPPVAAWLLQAWHAIMLGVLRASEAGCWLAEALQIELARSGHMPCLTFSKKLNTIVAHSMQISTQPPQPGWQPMPLMPQATIVSYPDCNNTVGTGMQRDSAMAAPVQQLVACFQSDWEILTQSIESGSQSDCMPCYAMQQLAASTCNMIVPVSSNHHLRHGPN